MHIFNKFVSFSPDTVSYLQRMEEERRARQQGATQDNRSFLQKYWIYFVPVVLFVVLNITLYSKNNSI